MTQQENSFGERGGVLKIAENAAMVPDDFPFELPFLYPRFEWSHRVRDDAGQDGTRNRQVPPVKMVPALSPGQRAKECDAESQLDRASTRGNPADRLLRSP